MSASAKREPDVQGEGRVRRDKTLKLQHRKHRKLLHVIEAEGCRFQSCRTRQSKHIACDSGNTSRDSGGSIRCGLPTLFGLQVDPRRQHEATALRGALNFHVDAVFHLTTWPAAVVRVVVGDDLPPTCCETEVGTRAREV